MNDANDRMKQDQAKREEKTTPQRTASANADDGGEQKSPERPIGSQKKATSNSRTPPNEV